MPVSRVAVITDSASDLGREYAARFGITVVPLLVNFGSTSYRAGVDMTFEQFWERMTAPDAPFPTTAAASPGTFKEAFEACFANGAEAVVCVTVGSKLSGTWNSAGVARDQLPDREIHIVDTRNVSLGQGLLAILATDLAAEGVPADAIARTLEIRTDDVETVVVADTLEYLKKGGRITASRAAIGTLLGVKPIIVIKDNVVDTAGKVRTRAKAREWAVEYATRLPIERLAVLHALSPDTDAFREMLLSRATGTLDRSKVDVHLVGPSTGPHIGPGAVGAAFLRNRPA